MTTADLRGRRGPSAGTTSPDDDPRAPSWSDAPAVALAALLWVLVLLDGGGRSAPRSVDLVLGALCCVAVGWRRRWPVAVAVLACLVGAYATSASGAALVALFTVAAHRRPAVVAPVVAGYAVAPFLTPLLRADLPATTWPEAVLGVALAAAVLGWGMLVRVRRQSLRERAARLEVERELLVAELRQGERDRIAREMHDVLAHRLSLLALHAGALELRPDAPPDEVARAAGVVRASAHQALEDLREVIGVLRAPEQRSDETPERPQPTLADLPELVEESRRAGTRVRLDHPDDLAAVPAAVGRSAYRIVQEGLTNARKHAPGAEVTLTVRAAPGDGVTVEVRNPLRAGSTGIPGAGAGLVGLAERAALAGGWLEHGPTPDGEFRLSAWLPWRPGVTAGHRTTRSTTRSTT